jgi:trehalose 6-phosphate phosphatase
MNQPRQDIPHLLDRWEQVSGRIRAAMDLWIFLDFDGTLVPYCKRPEDVKLNGRCRQILLRLSRRSRVHMAIVSGRRNAVLRKFVRVPGLRLMGLFGSEKNGNLALSRKTKAALQELGPVLAPLPKLFPGVIVENKGISYAVHFRLMPPEEQRRVKAWVRRLVARMGPSFSIIQSQHACEIVPSQVKGKGAAVREFTRGLQTPFLPIYVGDDLTDEPAYVALRRGITVHVHVGPASRTKARFQLRNPEEVCAFLERLEEELS